MDEEERHDADNECNDDHAADDSSSDDEEEEPRLKYQGLGGSLLSSDTISCITVTRMIALGTHGGRVHLLDCQGLLSGFLDITFFHPGNLILNNKGWFGSSKDQDDMHLLVGWGSCIKIVVIKVRGADFPGGLHAFLGKAPSEEFCVVHNKLLCKTGSGHWAARDEPLILHSLTKGHGCCLTKGCGLPSSKHNALVLAPFIYEVVLIRLLSNPVHHEPFLKLVPNWPYPQLYRHNIYCCCEQHENVLKL
ncbi:hypothetical protein SELMODRAFT_408553 [Selaginella moellendorffii]|uniref:Uncharacterized protein n=1 Tax=Selaginella moellendorffii TaxID=88036 RepID=D8R8N5_SELML|nr:hypothetical protein SELMODRAFT_408553 [Selaginella moellendorffii]